MFWGKLNQSASAQASKSVADKVTQLKAHNNQPTTNIFFNLLSKERKSKLTHNSEL